MKVATCRSCPARIVWCVTEAGKRMPVDAEPVPNGNVELRDQGHQVLAVVHGQPPLGVDRLHLSHFATCPRAADHRRRG
jgi:hypothetical protein